MGKRKRNEKARQIIQTVVADSAVKDVAVTIPNVRKDQYDASNEFILPNKKRKVKKIFPTNPNQVKKLTKKQRKRLEKLVDVKKKKANRKQLLEDLAKVQATKEELSLMVSTAHMQTKGLKRHMIELKHPQVIPSGNTQIRTLRGKSKEHRDESDGKEEKEETEESSSGDDDEEEEDDNDDEQNIESEMVADNVDQENVGSNKDHLDIQEDKKKDSDSPTTNPPSELTEEEKMIYRRINKRPATYIPVHRSEKIQEARLKLPILAEEQIIMEGINSNSITVLCGETGSGKTTQVPQFLYEAGYARGKTIGITEPRRVAAVSMSKRVAEEMNLSSDQVSYQIRFEGNVTPKTKIKFMTDGVLLKEIQSDFLLTGYSVVVIDEAHERSVYTDILIGLLSRIVPLRYKRKNPLKLIIMSATLRVEDFTENKRLFPRPPFVIQVDSRQFPVTIHFNKHTMENYVSEAYRKVCKIHSTLPSGGILVFVTGQQEVNILCQKLRRRFPFKKTSTNVESDHEDANHQNDSRNPVDKDDPFFKKKKKIRKKKKKHEKDLSSVPKINLEDYSTLPLEDDDDELRNEEVFSDLDDFDQEDIEDEIKLTTNSCSEPMYVLPLFSLMPMHKQAKVFQTPPEGTRLCVIATNVAETSLTIPNIKYVVDTGKVKTRFYDKVTGVSAFVVTWTSKAAADQRAGRAGRTAPGHCYRLYSSAVFNDQFEKFSTPEICRKPIDDLVLQMKDLSIDRVVNFPFPSSPDVETLKAAEKRLQLLGALEEMDRNKSLKDLKASEWGSKITPLGHAMACFPVAPCYGKMLSLSHQHGLLPFVVCIVSALTVQEVLMDGHGSIQKGNDQKLSWKQMRRQWAGEGNSLLLGDPMVLLKAIGAAEYAKSTQAFCFEQGLRFKAVTEVRKLRQQLTSAINLVLSNINLCVDPRMQPPNDMQAKLLRQIVLSGLPHHVARKISEDEIKEGEDKEKYKHAYQVMELNKTPLSAEIDDLVYIHPNSVLHKQQPEYIVYQEIFETSKMYMRGITAVEPEWLPLFAPAMCTFSKPLDDPKPSYNKNKDQITCYMKSSFGPHNWPLPLMELEYPEGLEKFKWFACFLLEGEVFPKLQKYRNVLLSAPSIMLKSWAKLQPRTENLLQTLLQRNITSKESLHTVWENDKNYLLKAYLEWIPESTHSTVAMAWPPI